MLFKIKRMKNNQDHNILKNKLNPNITKECKDWV